MAEQTVVHFVKNITRHTSGCRCAGFAYPAYLCVLPRLFWCSQYSGLSLIQWLP
ncbi:hypothetical protein ACGVWS_00795 [Enterobacteriaceae bacterium LUAb1]